MKTKDTPKTEVAVTTKVKLTIKDHVIEMTMEELKALHERIGRAIPQPTIITVEKVVYKEPYRHIPYYPPSFLQERTTPYQPDIWCLAQAVAETPPMNRLMGGTGKFA